MASSENIVFEKRSAAYWIISDSFLMAKRSITHIVRSLDQVMSLVLFPIMFMLLNSSIFGGAIKTGIDYNNYLFAGILVQTLAFGANYTTINLAVDLKEGIVDRFRSLPMATGSLLFGHIASDVVRNIISGLIIVVVGFVIGFRPNASAKEWLLVAGLGLLFTLAISWLSAILGLMVKSVEAAQWIGFVLIFPLTFVSNAFVPLNTLHGPVKAFATHQPLTQVITAMRAWLVGTPIGNAGWYATFWLIGIIVVTLPTAVWMFQRRSST